MGTPVTPFVDNGDDTHRDLAVGDVLQDANGVPYVLAGETAGVVAHYADLAAAIADTANLFDNQYVFVAGGDNQATGSPNVDRGIWQVVSNQGAAFSDYQKVMDVVHTASEVPLVDSANYFGTDDVESALSEIGAKQTFYKLTAGGLLNVSVSGSTTTAFNAAIDAIQYDNAGSVDLVGAGGTGADGIVSNASFAYQIPIRDASTRDVIDDGSDNEVYGRLTHDGSDYVVSFFSYVAGVETAYTFAAPTSIDLGYILASADFMRLPVTAGVVDGTFFGDQSGATGTINDENVVTNVPAFTGLLSGQATQQAVNLQVDLLGLAGNGEGASLIALEDAAGNFTTDNVEAALAELAASITAEANFLFYDNIAAAVADQGNQAVGDMVVIAGDAGNEGERGIYSVNAISGAAGDYTSEMDVSNTAAEVAIVDAGGNITATNVEDALAELFAAADSVITHYATLAAAIADTANLTDGEYVIIAGGDNQATGQADVDRGVWQVTANQGAAFGDYAKVLDVSDTAAEIAVADAGANFTATDVEGVLLELFNLINAISADNIKSLVFTAGEAIAATTNGPLLVSGTGTGLAVELANASNSGTNVEVVGFATGSDYALSATIDQGNGVVMAGLLDGFTGLTAGAAVYADPSSEGGITQTVPTTVGEWIIPVGVAVSATQIVVRVGEPNQIVPAAPVQQTNIWVRDTSGTASSGIGENGFSVAVNDIWIDNDASVQNPTKGGTGRHTVYICISAYTGDGDAITPAELAASFRGIGVQG